MRLTDVRLLVTDVDRSIRFFRDRVGLGPTLVVQEGVYAEFATAGATLSVYETDLMTKVVGESGGSSSGVPSWPSSSA